MRCGKSGIWSIGLLFAMLLPLTGCCQQQKLILQQRNDSLMQEVRDLEDRLNYSEYELLNVKEQYDLLRRAALGGEGNAGSSLAPGLSNPGSGSGGDFPTEEIPPLLIERSGSMHEMEGITLPGGANHTLGNPPTIASSLESEWPSAPGPPTDFLSIEQVSARTTEMESPEAIPVSFEEYSYEVSDSNAFSAQGWQSAN